MEKLCASFKNCSEPKIVKLTKGVYDILECSHCGHRYCKIENTANHVQEVYGDDYFFEGKQGYPNYLDEKDILLKYGRDYAKILSRYTSPGKMLNVGCAAGFILKGLEQAGWKCHGLEPNDTMASYGRKELGVNITTGDLESFKTTEKFDVVKLVQVIGHFTDLDVAIQNIAGLLNDKGLVLIESWDMKSLMATMMGKHWHEYSPPSVINWFSDVTLNQLFNYYGFKLIGKGRPSKKISIKHGLTLFDETMPSFPFKKGMMNFFQKKFGKYDVPYPPFDVKWYVFEKL
jgi:SAM-dependent methyltransferase